MKIRRIRVIKPRSHDVVRSAKVMPRWDNAPLKEEMLERLERRQADERPWKDHNVVDDPFSDSLD